MLQGNRAWIGAAVVSLLAGAGALQAQRAPAQRVPAQRVGGGTPAGGAVYSGSSRRGNLQEALEQAVAAASRSQRGADRLVRYRVREITGEQGGIAGTNTVQVTIELTR